MEAKYASTPLSSFQQIYVIKKTEKGASTMDHRLLMQWIESGSTTIPSVLLTYYKKIGLTNDELILLIQLKTYMDRGNVFPDTDDIASQMDLSSEKVFQLIHQLIQKKVLEIQTGEDEEGKSKDTYSLNLLWEKLAVYMSQINEESKETTEAQSEGGLYRKFEQEFGRPLSPIELQTIGMWLDEDHYSLELIEMALREAVLNQVYSLKYVDRILLSWEKKNIRTKEQVEKESQDYRNKKTTNNGGTNKEKTIKPVPLHNWLNDEN